MLPLNKTSALLLLPLVVVGPPDTTIVASSPERTGSIEGTVTLPPVRARRTARRYAGGAGAAQSVQAVPAVVYVRGAVAGAAGGGAESAEMVQRDSTFAPGAIAIQVGSTVDFPNQDPFFHNVFSYSTAQRFDLGRYPQGESKSVSFDTPGVVDVFCEVHERMRGAIVVTESPFHAVVGEDGSFRITGIPAGEHTLVFWHPDHETTEQTVTVSDGGTVRVEVELQR